MEKYFITIGRQIGSGGKKIGSILSERFRIPIYDKKLIKMASEESGLGKDIFEKADEKNARNNIFSSLLECLKSPSICSGDFYDNYINNDSLFKIQSDVIRSLAGKESCIFVGRCADYILRDSERCINIFITADYPDRIKRLVETENITEKEAAELIERTDKKRAAYYNYYSMKTWGAASSYHLCMNSSMLGDEATADFIERFIREKLGLQ